MSRLSALSKSNGYAHVTKLRELRKVLQAPCHTWCSPGFTPFRSVLELSGNSRR
jgi:hypothetical protein